MRKFSYRMCIALCASVSVIGLPGCQTTTGGASQGSLENMRAQPVIPKEVKSEDLLDAEGNWHLVEKGRSYDPAQAHLEARKRVNTKSWKRNKTLEAHFEPDAKSGEDGKVRVLKLQPDEREKTVAQSDNDSSFVDALSDFFGGSSRTANPIPKRKPTNQKSSSNVKSANAASIDDVVRVSGYPRMIDDVIMPPRLPDRKRVALALKADKGTRVSVPSKVQSDRRSVQKVPAVQKPALVNPVIVSKVRAGQHPDKVRMVVEVSRDAQYSAKVDTVRNVLSVRIKNATTTMEKRGAITRNPLLGNYIIRSVEGRDIVLDIRLKGQTKLINTMMLPPNQVTEHRIVIDLRI